MILSSFIFYLIFTFIYIIINYVNATSASLLCLHYNNEFILALPTTVNFLLIFLLYYNNEFILALPTTVTFLLIFLLHCHNEFILVLPTTVNFLLIFVPILPNLFYVSVLVFWNLFLALLSLSICFTNPLYTLINSSWRRIFIQTSLEIYTDVHLP